MHHLFNSNKKCIFTYLFFVFLLASLSLIGLYWGIYFISAVFALSGICNFFYLLLILNFNKDPEKGMKKGTNAVFSLLRIFTIALGPVVSFVLVHFLKSSTYDYGYVFLSIIPIFLSIACFYLRSIYDE